jgi:hypothetical protein
LDYLPLFKGTVLIRKRFSVFDDNQPKVVAVDRIATQWDFITAWVPGVKPPPGTHWLKSTIYWGRI